MNDEDQDRLERLEYERLKAKFDPEPEQESAAKDGPWWWYAMGSVILLVLFFGPLVTLGIYNDKKRAEKAAKRGIRCHASGRLRRPRK